MSNITSMSQLQTEIQARVKTAVERTRDAIYEIVRMCVDNYYDEYNPVLYCRLYHFADSLIKLDVKVYGTNVYTEVKIDEDYLNYTYPGGEQLTGLEVVEYAEAGTHGGWGTGRPFWSDAIKLMGGEKGIKQELIYNLKACGL